MSVPNEQKSDEQMRREAQQELVAELRTAELKWIDSTGEVQGFKRNPKAIWEALVNERIENEWLMQWVDDLQSGMLSGCGYCGTRFAPDPQGLRLSTVKQHIAQCPSHPMSELLRVLEAGWKMVNSSVMHVSHGGPSLVEAQKWLVEADTAIANVKGGDAV